MVKEALTGRVHRAEVRAEAPQRAMLMLALGVDCALDWLRSGTLPEAREAA